MFIEFIGIPGSGKSSIRKGLLAALQKEEYPATVSFEQAFYKVSKTNMDRSFRVFLKYLPPNIGLRLSQKLINRSLMQFEAQSRFLAKFGGALNAFLSSPQYTALTIEDRVDVIATFIQVGAMFECLVGRFPEQTRIVVDEGFIQKSFMFVTSTRDHCLERSFVHAYLSQVSLPDIVVRVITNREICYERLMNRSRGLTNRMQRLESPEKIKNFLDVCDEHLDDIVNWLNINTSIPVITILNNKELCQSIDDLVRHLKAV